MTTITQVIQTLTSPPNPDVDQGETYSDKAAITMDELATAFVNINTWAGQANTVAGEVNTNAATATTKASEASASALASASSAATSAGVAAFAGPWSSLSGAKTVPLSVSHEGAFWILLANVANVALEEPGVSSSWARAYGAGSIYTRSSNVLFTPEDSGKIIKYTSGTFSQTFTAAATLGASWYVYVINDGSGVVTLDPNSTELIDGAATKVVRKDTVTMVLCDGAAFTTVELARPVADSHVIVTTGAGNGGTNTAIRRFSTTLSSAGNAITYADSAANGGSFTINEAGLYSFSYLDGSNGSSVTARFGVSLNSNQLTTNIDGITDAHRLGMVTCFSNSVLVTACLSDTVRLASGDVLRAHTASSAPDNASAAGTRFSIRKVGP